MVLTNLIGGGVGLGPFRHNLTFFILGMVRGGELKAYSIKKNKEEDLRKISFTLVPVEEGTFRHGQPYILEDARTGNHYYFNESEIKPDSDISITNPEGLMGYIARLKQRLDTRNLVWGDWMGEHPVLDRRRASGGLRVAGRDGTITIEGILDPLLKRVYDFATRKAF